MSDNKGPFATVVADPPWLPVMALINSPATGEGAPKASPQRHYNCLTVDEICGMPPEITSKAHLWLWVVSQHIDWGYLVARAWGFEPLQTITWAKPGLGVGRFQCNTEHVLVCRKGSRAGNAFGATNGTWFTWPRGKHSEKPEDFYRLVERCSPGPYLEMFARKQREGWVCIGEEIQDEAPTRHPQALGPSPYDAGPLGVAGQSKRRTG